MDAPYEATTAKDSRMIYRYFLCICLFGIFFKKKAAVKTAAFLIPFLVDYSIGVPAEVLPTLTTPEVSTKKLRTPVTLAVAGIPVAVYVVVAPVNVKLYPDLDPPPNTESMYGGVVEDKADKLPGYVSRNL